MKKLWLSTLFFLCSCRSIYHVQEPTGSIEKTYLDCLETRVIEKGFFQRGDWPKNDYWKMFKNPELDRIVSYAIENNQSLQALWSNVKKAFNEADVVKSRLFPQLSNINQIITSHLSKEGGNLLSPNQGTSLLAANGDNNYTAYDVQLNMNWEIDFFGKLRYNYYSALSKAKMDRVMWQQSKLVLITAVLTTFFDLVANYEKKRITEKALAKQQEMLALTRLLQEKNMQSNFQINDVVAQVELTKGFCVMLKQLIASQKHMLLYLMGIDAGKDLKICSRHLARFGKVHLPDDLDIGLLVRRPDIIGAIYKTLAAKNQVRVARAEFFPAIHLDALGGLQSLNFSTLFSSNALTGTLLPIFRLPLYTGGRLTGNLKAKMHAYEATIHEYNNQVLEASKQVADAIVKIRALEGQIPIAETFIDAFQNSFFLTKIAYQHRLVSKIAVLQKEVYFLFAKIPLIDLEKNKNIEISRLMKELGGGFYFSKEEEKLWEK